MKYLNRFKFYNEGLNGWVSDERHIPDYLDKIENLKGSINLTEYVLDPINGLLYGKNADDGHLYYFKDPYSIEEDPDLIRSLKPKDLEILNPYFQSCEDLLKDRIDRNFLYDIKSMSLDYFDEGCLLDIRLYLDGLDISVCRFTISHNFNKIKWSKFFPKNLRNISILKNFNYKIEILNNRNGQVKLNYSEELISRIRLAYPDKKVEML